MQKKIIALAITAAFSAPAFADVTTYGVVDAAVANVSASGTKSDLSAHSGGLAPTRLGIKATEDLASGMKVMAVIEYGYDTETSANSAIKARQKMLALSGGFGTVATGYLQTTGYDFSRFDPTAGSLVTPLGNITKQSFLIGNQAKAGRASRALAYVSPDMSGLSVAVNYATGLSDATNFGLDENNTTTLKQTAMLLSANYKVDALAAAIVYAKKSDPNAGKKAETETAIGGSYDLEMAKLFATYQINKVEDADDSNKVLSISASVPVTAAGTAVVTYAKATMTANNVAGTDKNASGMTVAWLQGLSKTTTAYAAYSTMSQGDNTNAYSVAGNALSGTGTTLAGGTRSSMLAVGLSKKF